ncbi:MBL fold metallo-hydrolase [Rhodococcus sp. NPDC057014]|uniref:MBL fold metallo-hydrolase n=1 Tax=Rhodococcus sp. NPDC057014 TaxID=3346000 RepID=UPI00362B0ED7
MHTPGHTPGHMVFHDRGRNILFTGDHRHSDTIEPRRDLGEAPATVPCRARYLGGARPGEAQSMPRCRLTRAARP